MTTKLSLADFLDIAVSADSRQYITDICAKYPQVTHWLEHLLAKSVTHALLDYKKGQPPRFKSTALITQVASSTGRLISAEVRLSRRWQDVNALFRALLAITLCSSIPEISDLMVHIVPELYNWLCSEDGQILVAVADDKPVYMNMPVFDMVVPNTAQPYLKILRQCLGDSWTPASKLARSFNAILTQAVNLIMSFSWIFFDESTLQLVPSRLLGARILLCPADKFPDVTMLLKGLRTEGWIPLPASGSVIEAPANSTGVTEITLWQRDEWLIGLLAHDNLGSSIVIASPTLNGHLSLWRLLADESTPIAADPLASLTLKTYLGVKQAESKTASEAQL